MNFSNFLGLTDWEDSHILSQVLATSQQEYLDSLKQSRVSAGSDGANTIESSNSAINNSWNAVGNDKVQKISEYKYILHLYIAVSSNPVLC